MCDCLNIKLTFHATFPGNRNKSVCLPGPLYGMAFARGVRTEKGKASCFLTTGELPANIMKIIRPGGSKHSVACLVI